MPKITTTVNGPPKSVEVSEGTYDRIKAVCAQKKIHPQMLCRIIFRPLVENHIVPNESHVIAYLDKHFPS